MAVSIVSKQYGDDSQAPITTPTVSDGSFSTITEESHDVGQDNSPVAHTDLAQEKSDPIPETITNDSSRLTDLHPTPVAIPLEDKDSTVVSPTESIPNMYIQADMKNTDTPTDVPADVAIFSQEDAGGFDMDDLLGEEVSPTVTTAQEIMQPPSMPVAPNPIKDPLKQEESTIASFPPKTKAPVIAPKKSLTKSLAVVAAGLFGVVVIGFVVMTMFPAGIDGSQEPDDLITQEPIIQEPEEDTVKEHTVAEEQTPQQIARGELVNYSTLGEEYYTLGRDLKDRNMVRYALYVEKKAKDLIDLLDLDPNMDTKDIVVYFAQFDDYLKTLADWKAGLGDTIPASGSTAIVEEDMFTEPEDTFTDTLTTTADDTNTGSTQSGTSLTEPEQSELSDG